MKSSDTIDARAIRQKLGINQEQFWGQLGVTQSGGSRYESGRSMPRSVKHLLRIVYVEKVDIAKIRRDDIEIIDYLKTHKSALFKQLRQECRAALKNSAKPA